MGWIKPKGKRKKVQVQTNTYYWKNNSNGMLFTTKDFLKVMDAKRLTKYSFYQLERIKDMADACSIYNDLPIKDAVANMVKVSELLVSKDKVKKSGMELLEWATRSSAKYPRLQNYLQENITVKEFFARCEELHTKFYGTKYGEYEHK